MEPRKQHVDGVRRSSWSHGDVDVPGSATWEWHRCISLAFNDLPMTLNEIVAAACHHCHRLLNQHMGRKCLFDSTEYLENGREYANTLREAMMMDHISRYRRGNGAVSG